MVTIENAKHQAEVLAKYLLTVGKRLKHTQALEAIARVNGHKSWNIFHSSALAAGDASGADAGVKTPEDLVELFASDSVEYVKLDGVRYEVDFYDSEVLGGYIQLVHGDSYDKQSVGVVLLRNEAGLVWEEELTVERLSNARYQRNGAWRLGDGARMELFTTVRVLPA